MPKTTALEIMALTLAMTFTCPTYAVTVQPVTSVGVFDSHNKRLGIYSYADSSVLMLLDHTMQPVRVNKNGFVSEWEALFATPDCVGTPYMLANDVDRNSNDLVDATLYKQIGSVIWVGDPEIATTAITIRSRGNFDRCFRKDGLPAPGTSVLPLTELVDLNTLFTPPFHLIAK